MITNIPICYFKTYKLHNMTEKIYKDIMSRFKIWEKTRAEKALSELEEWINRWNITHALDILNHLLWATTKWIALLLWFMETCHIKVEDLENIIGEFWDYCNKECKDDKDASREFRLLKNFFAFVKYVKKDIDDD